MLISRRRFFKKRYFKLFHSGSVVETHRILMKYTITSAFIYFLFLRLKWDKTFLLICRFIILYLIAIFNDFIIFSPQNWYFKLNEWMKYDLLFECKSVINKIYFISNNCHFNNMHEMLIINLITWIIKEACLRGLLNSKHVFLHNELVIV